MGGAFIVRAGRVRIIPRTCSSGSRCFVVTCSITWAARTVTCTHLNLLICFAVRGVLNVRCYGQWKDDGGRPTCVNSQTPEALRLLSDRPSVFPFDARTGRPAVAYSSQSSKSFVRLYRSQRAYLSRYVKVDRGGIEPPTPGFSILCSTD